mmetsp:Transcript_38032/g.109697  ORF Transcript_38032/g.109697 Transcript_38032/m.109697 type:complete len:221 (-) Transcript_38032:368-1030(-)
MRPSGGRGSAGTGGGISIDRPPLPKRSVGSSFSGVCGRAQPSTERNGFGPCLGSIGFLEATATGAGAALRAESRGEPMALEEFSLLLLKPRRSGEDMDIAIADRCDTFGDMPDSKPVKRCCSSALAWSERWKVFTKSLICGSSRSNSQRCRQLRTSLTMTFNPWFRCVLSMPPSSKSFSNRASLLSIPRCLLRYALTASPSVSAGGGGKPEELSTTTPDS